MNSTHLQAATTTNTAADNNGTFNYDRRYSTMSRAARSSDPQMQKNSILPHATNRKTERNSKPDQLYANVDPSSSSSSSFSEYTVSNRSDAVASSSGEEESDGFFYSSVPSIEKDLDSILENRDLNPYYELNDEYDNDDECEFNVEDYLVDLDQYLDEMDSSGTTVEAQNHPKFEALKFKHSTLPRKRVSSDLHRGSPARNTITTPKDTRGMRGFQV